MIGRARYAPADLKQRLEEVWRTHGVACPNHFTRWTESKNTQRVRGGNYRFAHLKLYFLKGTLARQRPPRKKNRKQ